MNDLGEGPILLPSFWYKLHNGLEVYLNTGNENQPLVKG
jgi:hypothetical protein